MFTGWPFAWPASCVWMRYWVRANRQGTILILLQQYGKIGSLDETGGNHLHPILVNVGFLFSRTLLAAFLLLLLTRCDWQESAGVDESSCLIVVDHGDVLAAVRSAWDSGQVSILLRHTDKCTGEPDSCPKGSGLTAAGKRDAVRIGTGLESLLGTDYRLYSSKSTRAVQTAELGFQRAHAVVPWLREQCKRDLQQRLQAGDRAGNEIMVTHSTCMNVLSSDEGDKFIPFNAGGKEDYGLAVFMEKAAQPGEMPKILGCMRPADW